MRCKGEGETQERRGKTGKKRKRKRKGKERKEGKRERERGWPVTAWPVVAGGGRKWPEMAGIR